ncbi:DUF6474 family protein [Corynebacterium timonense]|uniref:Uncharacterized protein n=1 Tax=Corynebacterium timonense TaxID=441500 RepID=A0A1H1UWV0_9CORY|nr:DUF6474 family protein [Corynebacterium timonense]SDS77034.1 hypothetical protein SAMN04488539_2356 [Corynebacterium timonense]
MGIIETIRKSRAATKAEIKAAQARARQAAKEEAKNDRRTAELLDKAEKRLLKEEKKGLKRKRKHEKQLAEAHLKRIEQSGITKKKAKNWVGAARVLIPVLIPLVYRAITAAQQRSISNRAHSLGLSTQDLARFSGRGAELKARVEAIREQATASDDLSSSYLKDLDVRLDELAQAVRNAEHLNAEQQRLAHDSIGKEVDAVSREVQEKLSD